jgi:hypothetical protein
MKPDKNEIRQQCEDLVVVTILRTASEEAFSLGPLDLADLTVADVLYVAKTAKAPIGRSGVLAALKRLLKECRVSRCKCNLAHWRYLPPEELAAFSRGNA